MTSFIKATFVVAITIFASAAHPRVLLACRTGSDVKVWEIGKAHPVLRAKYVIPATSPNRQLALSPSGKYLLADSSVSDLTLIRLADGKRRILYGYDPNLPVLLGDRWLVYGRRSRGRGVFSFRRVTLDTGQTFDFDASDQPIGLVKNSLILIDNVGGQIKALDLPSLVEVPVESVVVPRIVRDSAVRYAGAGRTQPSDQIVLPVRFSPDGRSAFVSSVPTQVRGLPYADRIVSSQTGATMYRDNLEPVLAVAWSKDSRYLFVFGDVQYRGASPLTLPTLSRFSVEGRVLARREIQLPGINSKTQFAMSTR